jgi:ATP-binding cassette subfamily B protein RaxB
MRYGLDLGFWRHSRIGLVRQSEIAECGLASLTMIANSHGLRIDLATMRNRFPPSVRGATLKSLIAVADRIGLIPRAVKLPIEQISKLSMPAILHWNLNHFVVIERHASKRGALVHDPMGQSRWYTAKELSAHFTGVALELRPAADFERGDSRRSLQVRHLWHRIVGLKRSLLQILVLTVVLQAVELITPYYMQVALDWAVPALDLNLLVVLALGFALLAILNALATFMRSFVLLSAGASLSIGLTSNIARRLLRLPVEWFEKRHIGDILSRFQSVTPIQTLLTEGAIGSIVDGVLIVMTFAVMLFYSGLLAAVGLLTLAAYLLVRLSFLPSQRQAVAESIIARGDEQTNMIESLRAIATLRLSAQEMLRHAEWQSKQIAVINASVQLARIVVWHTTIKGLLFGLESVAAIYLAAGFVIKGGFSVGMVFAYVAYKTRFLATAQSLIDRAIEFRMLTLHLERLSDIAFAQEDPSFGASAGAWTDFRGELKVINIVFRYSMTEPVVLDGVSFSVAPGEHVVITGPSGGGKSTLAKIMLGLVEPTSGEVLVDGKPLALFGYKSYHAQIAAVLQDDVLLSGSLADNIALFDEGRDMARVFACASAAEVHDEIMRMPMGYQTLVGSMGIALSGGQKQRVLLARALYRRPKLLILDEGTAHLDFDNERKVNAAIARLGITRIIIAHRQETVACAQRILTLRNGMIAE